MFTSAPPGLRRKLTIALRLFALVALLSVFATSSFEPARASTTTFALRVGSAHFWDGGYVDHAQVYDPSKCNVLGPCWTYHLQVNEPGARLRVAINLVFGDPSYVRYWSDYLNFDAGLFSQDSVFNVQLYDPQGQLYVSPHQPEGGVSQPTMTTDYGYTREVFVPNPATGRWTIKVIPVNVLNMGFRMRAKLEAAPAAPGVERVLNPNLRLIPPFEVNFNTPTFTYGPSTTNNGNASSCMTEEWVEADAEGDVMTGQCLRLTAGVENVGPGPLLLMATCNEYPYLGHPECKQATGPLEEGTVQMYQRRMIQKANGTLVCCAEEPVGSAGLAEYHDFHGHFHYEDVYVYELYRVTTAGWHPTSSMKPALEYVRSSQKRGFWPWDERMADWNKFYQSAQDINLPDATLRIGAGWGDAYEYNRGGQFIAFPVDAEGEPQAGYYLIRGTADIDKKLIEEREDDNVGYALIEVGGLATSTAVKIVERGYGQDPWDPGKQVVTSTP